MNGKDSQHEVLSKEAVTRNKKPYEKPAILDRELIETVAAACASGGGYKNLGNDACSQATSS